MKHGSERCPGVRAWSIVSCDDLKRANSYSKTRRPPSVSLASSTSRRWRAKSYILPFIICHLSPLPGHGRATDQLHTSAHVSLTATRDSSASEKGLGRARRQRYLHCRRGRCTCYQSWPAILAALILYYTSLLQQRAFTIYMQPKYIISFKGLHLSWTPNSVGFLL